MKCQEKCILIIMAHADAQVTVNRHMPMWSSLGMPICFFTPINSRLNNIHNHSVYSYGPASHHGPSSIDRFKELLKFLENLTYCDLFFILEYDAICTEPKFMSYFTSMYKKDEPFFCANIFGEGCHRIFKSTMFTHPPLLFNRTALTILNKALAEIPDWAEQGFWDRFLGLALDRTANKIKPINFRTLGLGFSLNTIEPEHFNHIKDIIKKNPKTCFYHGVKTKSCLDLICSFK